MNILEFLAVNYGNGIVIFLMAFSLFWRVKIGYKSQVNEMLMYLVTRAESIYGDGTGELKYSVVVTWVYERLPSLAKVILSKNDINGLIEKAVHEMKNYLSENCHTQALIDKNMIA